MRHCYILHDVRRSVPGNTPSVCSDYRRPGRCPAPIRFISTYAGGLNPIGPYPNSCAPFLASFPAYTFKLQIRSVPLERKKNWVAWTTWCKSTLRKEWQSNSRATDLTNDNTDLATGQKYLLVEIQLIPYSDKSIYQIIFTVYPLNQLLYVQSACSCSMSLSLLTSFITTPTLVCPNFTLLLFPMVFLT